MLNWILLRCIWCELDTRYRPFLTCIMQINCFKIRTKIATPVIRCTIPADNEPFSCILESEIFNKDERPLRISCIAWDDTQLARERINCAIIGLALTLIANRHRYALVAWTPHIATCIIPSEMTFVKVQYDDLFCGNICCQWCQEIVDVFFFAAICAAFFAGLVCCAFLYVNPASASNV